MLSDAYDFHMGEQLHLLHPDPKKGKAALALDKERLERSRDGWLQHYFPL
jgi:hypothetical protein